MTKLSVIIVNYYSCELLNTCLLSLFGGKIAFPIEVIIVDNGSINTKIEVVKRDFPSVHLIRNGENTGFSSACNRGASAAVGKYLLFLNPDTILHENAITHSIEFMEANPDTGIIGCRTLNPDGSIQSSSWKFPSLFRVFLTVSGLGPRFRKISGLVPRPPQDPDYVQGAYLMISSNLFRKAGGFDEQYFLFGEDTDLCLRVKKMDKQIRTEPSAIITHMQGGCFRDDLYRLAHLIRGYKLLYRKHCSKLKSRILHMSMNAGIRCRFPGALIPMLPFRRQKKFCRQLVRITKEQ